MVVVVVVVVMDGLVLIRKRSTPVFRCGAEVEQQQQDQ